jgi:hypothetical protein
MSLLRGSPGWQSQQIAKSLITLPATPTVVADLAKTIVDAICKSYGKVFEQKFSGAGVLEMLGRLNVCSRDEASLSPF